MKKIYFMMVFGALLMSACQQDATMVEVEEQQPVVETVKKAYTTEVDKDDVIYLAGKFNAGQAQTKSVRSIESVSTLVGEDGKPSIYVVNYADNRGFVLVSATKNYHPILAYNDEGYFNLWDEMPGALDTWVDNMKSDISYAKQLPLDSVFAYRTAWSKFEEGETFVLQPSTRTTTNSELDSYVMPMLSQWVNEGKVYYGLEAAANILPSDVYATFCANAESSVFPLYDYMNYSFVVVEEKDNGSGKRKNSFEPQWVQGNGFNDSLPLINGQLPPAGCATIAMAQVMRHFKSPTHYAWDKMPYITNYATKEIASFIKEVADKINANYALDGTSASLEDVCSSLKNDYEYSTSIKLIPHSIAQTRTEINSNRPVIMQGFDSEGGGGHAWVVSGYDRIAGYTEYQLWVPINNVEITTPYSHIDSYSDNYYDYTDIYIHWGWGAGYDGYYLDSNISVLSYEFNSIRKDIVNIAP